MIIISDELGQMNVNSDSQMVVALDVQRIQEMSTEEAKQCLAAIHALDPDLILDYYSEAFPQQCTECTEQNFLAEAM